MKVVFALSYGGRAEIVDAARKLARDAEHGKVDPEAIDEKTFAAYLYDPELPDPDLLIRTGGESRVSNFLLWQIAYAEIFATDVMWPDFRAEHLRAALRDYQRARAALRADQRAGARRRAHAREAPRDARQHRQRRRADARGRGGLPGALPRRRAGRAAQRREARRPGAALPPASCVSVAEPAGARASCASGSAAHPVEIAVGPGGARGGRDRATPTCVVAALVGAAGLEPTLAAIRAGRDVALAEQGSAGDGRRAGAARGARARRDAAARRQRAQRDLPGARRASRASASRRLILTASGGPFRTWPARAHRARDASRRRCATRTGRWGRRSRSTRRR